MLSGLVLGLTQVVKMTVNLNSKYIPAVAIVISIVLLLGYALWGKIPFEWKFVEESLVVGLASVGLWSGVKNTIN